MPADTTASTAQSPISRAELIAMLAMLTATVAFSIDAMLPALPDIGEAINPADPQRAQLVIASFIIGLGFGLLFAGPLSDAFGRRPIALAGAVIYTLAALYAATTESLTAMLVARAVQGVGAAGPRVVTLALIRDLFTGRQMARITSYVMTVFALVPVLAPSLGAGIAWAFGWRAIFLSFAVFSFLSVTWLLLRQPETLASENRRPFRLKKLTGGLREVFSNRQVVLSIIVQTLLYGMLFASLMSSQAVFGEVFDKAESFPFWFGLMAAISASSSWLNAQIVLRFGMRNVVKWAFLVQATGTALFLLAQVTIWAGDVPWFPIAFLWMTTIFFMAGIGIGNLNAIAMEPMGHMAGMAASIVSATSTVASVALAAPVGQLFDGTMVPLTACSLGMAALAYLLILRVRDSEGIV